MAQPKHQTPPPAEYHLWRQHQRHQGQQQQQRGISEDTPAWINDEVRPIVREGMGLRAKKTQAAKPKHHITAPERPMTEGTFLLTRAICWDCGGDGKSGAILYPCPVCGTRYTWPQIEARADAENRDVRDKWGAIYLPCSAYCQRIPSNRIYGVHEECPTCKGQGFLDEYRQITEFFQRAFEYACRQLGINDATMPTPVAFQQSEPTAPPPHLGHGNVTPQLPPLAPERESGEF